MWKWPEAMYAVLQLAKGLPHLWGAVITFFEGALATWDQFTLEFAPGGMIADSTESECQQAWMGPSNDPNKGGLGELRGGTRHTPNMTIDNHNAQVMYQKNNNASFIWLCMSEADCIYLQKRAIDDESSREVRKWQKLQAEAHQQTVTQIHKNMAKQMATRTAKEAQIDVITPQFDIEDITKAPGSCNDLDLHLDWFRRQDPLIPKKSHIMRHPDKKAALIAAVKCYNVRAIADNGNTSGQDEEQGPQDVVYGEEEESDEGL